MQEESNQPHELMTMSYDNVCAEITPGPRSLVLNLWVATFAGVGV